MPAVAPRIKTATVQMDRFDGGLNLRDAPTELSLSETPDCMNITLNERGGVETRLGVEKLNGASLLPAAPMYLYYSTIADAVLAYISTFSGQGRLYKSTNAGVTWSEVTWAPGPPLFTAGATAAIIDFAGVNGPRVVVVNTIDGVYSFPAALTLPTRTTGGAANMDEVRGNAIAVWQNKLWVTGDTREDTTHSKARVWRSNAGTEQLWTVATDFTDIRDIDTTGCTAIGAGAGMDVTGKPTLLVYKQKSTYRINDSASGAYTTLHSRGAGAASAKAVASTLGRICSINGEGIWVTDGMAVPIRVTDKLQPLFGPEGLNLAQTASWSAAPFRDRVIFAVTRAGSSTNNLVLEYHPELGWTVPHDLKLGPMTLYTKDTLKLFSAAAAVAAVGAVYETFKSGNDDGADIVSRFQTRWVPVGDGDEGRLRYLRLQGRKVLGGALGGGHDYFRTEIRTDFSTQGETYHPNFDEGTGGAWDIGLWDGFVWGDPRIEGPADLPLDQVCKYVSIVFKGQTSTAIFRPPLLGDGSSTETGAWGIYEAKLDHIPLGT